MFDSKLSRRAILGGMAGGAMALPLLNVRPATADAGSVPSFPKRLVIFATRQGTIYENMQPKDAAGLNPGKETDFHFTLPSSAGKHILAPLEDYKQDLIVTTGIDLTSAYVDQYNAHYRAFCHMLTGTPMGPPAGVDAQGYPIAGWAGGISIDQHIANRIGANTQFRSLEFGGRTNSKSNGNKPFDSQEVVTYLGAGQPVPHESDPIKMFNRIFASLQLSPSELLALRAKRQSVLDGVKDNFARYRMVIAAEDRIKLDNHLDRVREIERQISVVTDPSANCVIPTLDLQQSDWRTTGPVGFNAYSDLPNSMNAQMDMLVMSLACDLTRVCSVLYAGDAHEWLPITPTDAWHDTVHLGWPTQSAKDWLTETFIWYASQFASLLGKMKSIPEGNGTLLDNSIVLWTNEMGNGSIHSHIDIPFIVAGSGGGAIKTGRYLDYGKNGAQHQNHNDLYVSLLQAFDQPDLSFGDPQYCNGVSGAKAPNPGTIGLPNFAG